MDLNNADGANGCNNKQVTDMTGRDIRALVSATARRIVRLTCIPDGDLIDVEQTLLAALCAALPTFDPDRGDWLAFARHVVKRSSSNLLRDRFAAKRDPRRQTSLHLTIKVEDQVYGELGDQITYDHRDSQEGRVTRTEVDAADLRMDMCAFIDTLPKKLRQLATDLLTKAPIEISEQRRIPLSTIQSRREQLRRRAENVELQNYLRR